MMLLDTIVKDLLTRISVDPRWIFSMIGASIKRDPSTFNYKPYIAPWTI